MLLFLSLLIRPSPRSTRFPYTTLFRSAGIDREEHRLGSLDRDVASVDDTHRAVRQAQAQRSIRLQTSKFAAQDRKSTRLNSSHVKISYAVFCLKKKIKKFHIILLENNT